MQPVAHGQLGGDLGDGEAGGLGGQRAGAADPRVHFDHHHPAGLRINRELDIRAARLDADLPHHGDAGVAHPLVLFVGQRLGRGHGDGIARMHAHRIEVLDAADDHDIVIQVAHHLHLVLFPAQHGFLDQHLRDGGLIQARAHQGVEFAGIVGDRGAGAAQGKAGTHDARHANVLAGLAGLFDRTHRLTAADFQPDPLHRRLELVAFLGFGDHGRVGPDHFHAVLFQHAVPIQVHGQIQAGLAAQGGQKGVGPLPLDHLGDGLPGQRLDVRAIGHRRVRHDGGRIRVDQDHFVAFLAQRLAGLRTGIVELAGLADDDRAGTNQQNLVNVVAAGHVTVLSVKVVASILNARAHTRQVKFFKLNIPTACCIKGRVFSAGDLGGIIAAATDRIAELRAKSCPLRKSEKARTSTRRKTCSPWPMATLTNWSTGNWWRRKWGPSLLGWHAKCYFRIRSFVKSQSGWVGAGRSQLPMFPRRPRQGSPPRRLVHPLRSPGATKNCRTATVRSPRIWRSRSPRRGIRTTKWRRKSKSICRRASRLVWIVNPHTRTVLVYRKDRDTVSFLHEADELSGEDVLPGFRCPVRDVFPPAKSGGEKA